MGGRGSKSGVRPSQDANLIAGRPGEYTLYRSGELESSGFIFLSTDKTVADSYSQGGTRETKEYKVRVNNPLVIEGEDMDTVALRKAWLALHPDKSPEDYRKLVKGGMTSAKWQKIDKANAQALLSSPYDAVVYKNGNKVHEVWVHSNRRKEFK